MSLKIELGLFNLDFTDYHAILGVPVDIDPKEIRKSYLKIARQLHPDSRGAASESDRHRAEEYLSKLVNPAYEKLSQEKNYSEYCVLLKMKGQQALKQQETVMLLGEASRRLASATGDIEQPYRAALRELSDKQYQQLDRTLEWTGQISELNLVYLMRKAKQGEASPISVANSSAQATPVQGGAASNPFAASKDQKRPPTQKELVAAALRRVDEFEKKQDFPRAILELRETLQQIDANNSACHSRLGSIYLKTKQATMAKIHFKKALQLDPKDAIALDGMQKLEQGATVSPTASKSAATNHKSSKPGQKGGKSDEAGGGLFGLFGGKKK